MLPAIAILLSGVMPAVDEANLSWTLSKGDVFIFHRTTDNEYEMSTNGKVQKAYKTREEMTVKIAVLKKTEKLIRLSLELESLQNGNTMDQKEMAMRKNEKAIGKVTEFSVDEQGEVFDIDDRDDLAKAMPRLTLAEFSQTLMRDISFGLPQKR